MTIKDSGERREFETGAVRDIAEGKGRCDLMPLDIVAEFLDIPCHRETFIATGYVCCSRYYGNGFWECGDDGVVKNRIIAWQPLPEPYTIGGAEIRGRQTND